MINVCWVFCVEEFMDLFGDCFVVGNFFCIFKVWSVYDSKVERYFEFFYVWKSVVRYELCLIVCLIFDCFCFLVVRQFFDYFEMKGIFLLYFNDVVDYGIYCGCFVRIC